LAKLNLGSSVACGQYRKPGWINLDLHWHKGVNVIASGFALPFKDNTFEAVHSVHVLEHLTRDKFPIMLKEMARVLHPAGFAFVEVPDFKKTVELLHSAYTYGDEDLVHQWRTSIYGKTERPGMAHHFGFDELTLKRYMHGAGFSDCLRLVEQTDMISSHYLQEPVLLIKARKT
jgi:predicted SAM-dependent methyltransferase